MGNTGINNQIKDKVLNMLKDNYVYVKDMLLFAEAKHAALIAFNTVFLTQVTESERSILQYSLIFVILLSLIISLISFLPQLKKRTIQSYLGIENNLVYFNDISKYDAQNYLKAIYKKYFNKDNIYFFDNQLIDLADEIVTNSSILIRKYRFFKVSCILDLGAIIVVILVYLINLVELI